jgi:hypothetical protein
MVHLNRSYRTRDPDVNHSIREHYFARSRVKQMND